MTNLQNRIDTAYDALVAQVRDYLADRVRDGIDPASLAAQFVRDDGRLEDGELTGEIPGRYTRTGNPLTMDFDAQEYARLLNEAAEA